jgi:hydroxymethylpyrimidine pyrophosphatase-like HAD family hydrolase
MMDGRPDWIATDLDGTLFSRRTSLGAVAGTWRTDSTGIEQPSSWMPRARHAFLSRVSSLFRVVPVTARDADSYSRVRIDGVPLRDGAVLANGAIILQPGTMLPDPTWDAEIAPQLAAWAEPLAEMAARLTEASGGSVIPRLVNSHTPHPAYLVAKATEGYWGELDGLRLREVLAPFKCRVAELGRELQVLPPPISKRLGIAAFARAYCADTPPVLALGDMPEDLGFLREAEFLAAPSDSTLARRWCDGV